jgi:hypothetical protein
MSNIVEIILKGSDQSSRAITSAVKNLEGMGSAFSAIRSSLAGIVSAGALVALGHSALQLGDDLSKASKKFEMAVEDLSALRYAAELADVPFESLEVGLAKLSQAMVSGAEKGSDMSYAFKALGVDIKSYGGNIGTALVDISRKIIEVDNAAARVDFSKSIFGRSGANMIPVMGEIAKGFGSMRTEAEKFNALMTEDQAKRMEKYNENLKSVKLTTTQVTAEVINFAGEISGWIQRATVDALKLEKALSDIAEKTLLGGTFKPKGDTSGAVRFKAPPLPPATKTKTIEQIKAEEEAAKAKEKLDEDYQKLHAANLAREGKEVHENLAAEMGWSQEYFDTVSKLRTQDFEDWKKIEEEIVKLDAASWEERGKIAHEGLLAEMGDKNEPPQQPYLFEDAMKAAEQYGNVSLAIQTMNSDLGAQFLIVQEGQSYIALYKQAWLDANLAIADSITSLYSGMQDWISSSIQGLVEGTMTIQNVMANLGKMMLSIIADYIAKWIVSRLFMAAMEKTMTATSIAMEKMATVAFVGSKIAQATASTGAGAARALSEFPWPYSAGVAAAVLAEGAAIIAGMTAVSVVAGAAHGGLDYVPAESTYLLDRGERVVSPKQNEDLTDFLNNGGGGNLSVHLYMDGEAICNVVKKGVRQGRLNLQLA